MCRHFLKKIASRVSNHEKGPFGHITWLNTVDRLLIWEMHHWAIPLLRISLAIVYLWFGILKIVDATPIYYLVSQTYTFFPVKEFLFVLGWWEVIIGIGLLSRRCLRITLVLLWLQMAGTFVAVFLAPPLFFFQSNPFLLTMEGEFIIKNFVLISSSLVIGGYEINHWKKK